MYLTMRRRSYTFPDLVDTTGCRGGSPEMAQKNMVVVACLLQPISQLPMSEKQQRLVYAIIEFLNQSIRDGTVKVDDLEGLEVASKSPILFES